SDPAFHPMFSPIPCSLLFGQLSHRLTLDAKMSSLRHHLSSGMCTTFYLAFHAVNHTNTSLTLRHFLEPDVPLHHLPAPHRYTRYFLIFLTFPYTAFLFSLPSFFLPF